MNSKDFRKGNFVQNKELDIFKSGYVELEARHIYEMAVKESAQEYNSYVDHFKPLPLTVDWLLKLGFREPVYCDLEEFDYSKEYDLHGVHLQGFEVYIHDKTGFKVGCKEGIYFYVEDIFNADEEVYITSYSTGFTKVHKLQNLFYSLKGEELNYAK